MVSVIIPSNRGPAALHDCLAGLAEQTAAAGSFEVLVCLNGAAAAGSCGTCAWPAGAPGPADVRVLRTSQPSAAAARNLGIDAACGDLLLFLNDDVRPAPDCLERHIAAHRELAKPALVLGAAPWRLHPGRTLMERVVAETSLIFFYDQMVARHWYGFRHAWSLNLSVPSVCARRERFDGRLSPVNFEDLEWAWRLEMNLGARVWYEPAASVVHDHRYSLADYLARETQCGGMAARLWEASPRCFEAIFGRPLDRDFVAFLRQVVQCDAPSRAHAAQYAAVERLAQRPVERSAEATASEPHDSDDLVGVLFAALQPMRKAAFRRGLLAAIDGSASRAGRVCEAMAAG